jgi:hypothetical protein
MGWYLGVARVVGLHSAGWGGLALLALVELARADGHRSRVVVGVNPKPILMPDQVSYQVGGSSWVARWKTRWLGHSAAMMGCARGAFVG